MQGGTSMNSTNTYDTGKFATNLDKIRIERHLSRYQLADLLDIDSSLCYCYLKGSKKPRVESLIPLAKKLNVSVSSLFR